MNKRTHTPLYVHAVAQAAAQALAAYEAQMAKLQAVADNEPRVFDAGWQAFLASPWATADRTTTMQSSLRVRTR